MRGTWIKCDWCDQDISTHYVRYQTVHIGGYATSEGARDAFDFCGDDHMTAWLAHGRHRRSYVEYCAAAFGELSDEDLAASTRVGTKTELLRRRWEARP